MKHQEAIEVLYKMLSGEAMTKEVIDAISLAIDALKSKIKPNWILFSEQFPPNDTPVWITLRESEEPYNSDENFVDICTVFKYSDGSVSIDAYNYEGYPTYDLEDCIAWMPYHEPEPYRG